jgi:Flp pilus assembly protein TadD
MRKRLSLPGALFALVMFACRARGDELEPLAVEGRSALWSIETIELLWQNRKNRIAEAEREEALQTFERAIGRYREIAEQAPGGS